MRERTTTPLLLALIAVMTCLPLLRSWYTTADDILIDLGLRSGVKMVGLGTAQVTGRLQHVITGSMAPMAYGWGHYGLMKVFALTAILASVGAMAFVVRLLSGSMRLASLAVLFFFAFAQNTYDHNLLTAFPFISTLALAAFWLSVATWWLALQGRRWLGVVSVLLFVFSLLTYENFLVYACVFPVLTMAARPATWRQRLLGIVRTPHVAATLLVFVAIVLFRASYQSDYGRQAMASEQYEINLDPVRVLKVLGRYGTSAFPLHYARPYRDMVTDFYMGFGVFRLTLNRLFRVLDAGWLAKAVIAGYLTAMLTLRRDRERVQHRGLLWLLAFVFIVLTNLPLAITTKYQVWVIERMSQGYLTSYFVFFGVVILIALLFDECIGWLFQRSRRTAQVVGGLLALLVCLVTYQTDVLNAHVSLTQQRMYERWRTVDQWIDSPVFAAVPEGSLILAPSLFEHYPQTVTVFDDYWTQYVRGRTGKGVEVFHYLADWRARAKQLSSARLYYLGFSQEPRGEDSYLVFSALPGAENGIAMESRDVRVLAHAKADRFRLFGRLLGTTECRGRLLVDDMPTNALFTDRFAVQVDHPRSAREWRWIRLASEDAAMDPVSIVVADSDLPVDRPVEIMPGQGFQDDELAYRWAEGTAVLTLWNREGRALKTDLQFEVQAPGVPRGGEAQLDVTAGATRVRWPVGPEYTARSLRIDIPPASTVDVVFKTDAPKAQVPHDSRTLVLRFGPAIHAREVGCDKP